MENTAKDQNKNNQNGGSLFSKYTPQTYRKKEREEKGHST